MHIKYEYGEPSGGLILVQNNRSSCIEILKLVRIIHTPHNVSSSFTLCIIETQAPQSPGCVLSLIKFLESCFWQVPDLTGSSIKYNLSMPQLKF
jgi:hypothetical protein